MRIHEINDRLAAIGAELDARGSEMKSEEIDALEREVRTLTDERDALIEVEKRKQEIRNAVALGAGTVIASGSMLTGEARGFTPEDPASVPEYRTAWLKRIRKMPLSEAETRAYANATGTGAEVIPTHTANEIISKVKKLAPMLNEVTLLHVKGMVRYAVEGTNNAATIHAENATITAAADTLTEVKLSGFEIVKLVQISDTVMTMSIEAFESWLTTMLAEAIARKIEDLIINGTGTNQPKGINAANTWDDTNSVTVGASASLTAANVQALIGILPAGYDHNSKFLMRKSTLFMDFMPLMDSSKNHIVTVQGNEYFIYGYPVLLSDYVAEHEALLGNHRKYVANLAEAINVKTAYDINTNSYKFSGIAIFDGTPAIGEAFVKLAKASA